MRTLYVARYFVILIATIFIMSVSTVFAVDAGLLDGNSVRPDAGALDGNPSPPDAGGIEGGAQPGETVGLINPLKAKSISEFLVAIVDVLLIFATPLIVIYIMYAGFKFVTAQGNPSEIESARAALLWAVVGGVIVLGAKLIIEVIDGTIKAFSP